MNIYKVTRKDWVYYDEYAGFVVAANSSDQVYDFLNNLYNPKDHYSVWPVTRDSVKIELVGLATPEFTESQIILKDFRAG